MSTSLEITVISYTQLKDNLTSLRKDSAKLEALVKKYDKIHDEGPGRRLLFTLRESNGLTDLRRRIGLHEQILQIWYMTLIYSSLRRLEGGQEDILKAIEAMKNWSPRKMKEVRRSLRRGDIKPLEEELCKSGLKPQAVDAALGTAVDYVDAPPHEKIRMESHVRSRSSHNPGKESGIFRSTVNPVYPPSTFDHGFGKKPGDLPPPPPRNMRRGNSTSARRTHHTDDSMNENDTEYKRRGSDDLYEPLDRMKLSERLANAEHREKERKAEYLRNAERDETRKVEYLRKDKRYPSYNEDIVVIPADSRRPRRSSETATPPPRGPLLVVPDTGPRYRPASFHGTSDQHVRRSSDAGSRNAQEPVIILEGPPRPHRSSSRRSDRSNRESRDSSTHSYTRRRSPSGGQEGEEPAGRRRMITKMDRIDSIPT